ncbi:MAG TPA: TolC family protein [Candidatus Limnocylindria bacterium]|nr:TolC family protein [Candidatus Limnocylindria bacterium]
MILPLLVFSLSVVSQDTLRLSLPEAVTIALREADEVKRANADVSLTEAQVTTSRASALPQLRLTGTYNHVLANARARAVNQVFNQPNTYNVNANLSQTLFQGGREFASWRAARRVREAARLTAGETKSEVAVGVLRAYLEASLAERFENIRGENLILASQRVEQSEQLFTAGRVARYDVLRSRVERANLEPLVIQARNDREIALLDLRRLLNLPPDAPIRLTTTIDSSSVSMILAASSQDDFDGSNRASVRAAELTARARRDAIAAARADWLPTITVFFQSGVQAFPQSGFPPGRGETSPRFCPEGSPADRSCQNGGWFGDRALGVNFSWPLFDGLRAKGAIDLAQAQHEIAEIALAQEREAVALEIARARAELSRSRAVFAARRQTVSEADEAFRLASLRYSRGIGTSLEVSDSQLQLLISQTDEAQSAVDLYLAAAELARALGRPIPLPGGTVISPQTTANAP